MKNDLIQNLFAEQSLFTMPSFYSLFFKELIYSRQSKCIVIWPSMYDFYLSELSSQEVF